MRKFVAESRTLSLENPLRLELTVVGVNRLPRKKKKTIKTMAKKISTVTMLRYIAESEE